MLSSAQVHELVERMLKSSGRRIDISQPSSTPCFPRVIGSASCSRGSVADSGARHAELKGKDEIRLRELVKDGFACVPRESRH